MPVLTPAGPPALHVDLGGQGHELEVWQAPGGVSCDTGSPQTEPRTPKIARVVGPFTALACLSPGGPTNCTHLIQARSHLATLPVTPVLPRAAPSSL